MGVLVDHSKRSRVIQSSRLNPSRCLATKLADVLPTNSWKGETCFLIGGGPSLVGFDWKLLQGCKTIGTNKSFFYYPAEINYSMDYSFFDLIQYAAAAPEHPDHKYHIAWIGYKGLKVFLRRDAKLRFAKDIYFVDVLKEKVVSRDLAKGLSPGNNTGIGALMLAVALGCSRIGLLGYDFKIQGSKTHFHDGYRSQRSDALVRNLEKFRRCLEEFADPLAKQGIEVVNLSPDSLLQRYPKSDIPTFLRGK